MFLENLDVLFQNPLSPFLSNSDDDALVKLYTIYQQSGQVAQNLHDQYYLVEKNEDGRQKLEGELAQKLYQDAQDNEQGAGALFLWRWHIIPSIVENFLIRLHTEKLERFEDLAMSDYLNLICDSSINNELTTDKVQLARDLLKYADLVDSWEKAKQQEEKAIADLIKRNREMAKKITDTYIKNNKRQGASMKKVFQTNNPNVDHVSSN